jgi:hypothetical protein
MQWYPSLLFRGTNYFTQVPSHKSCYIHLSNTFDLSELVIKSTVIMNVFIPLGFDLFELLVYFIFILYILASTNEHLLP